MNKYNSNWIIEGLHLNTAVYNPNAYDIQQMQNTIIDYCNKNNFKYKLIMCIPPDDKIPEHLLQRYQEYKNIYNQYKASMSIYKYDYTTDPDYTQVDEYIERN